MFGGLAFLVGGNMAVAASGQGGVLVRVDPSSSEALLKRTKARPMECADARWRVGCASTVPTSVQSDSCLGGSSEVSAMPAPSRPSGDHHREPSGDLGRRRLPDRRLTSSIVPERLVWGSGSQAGPGRLPTGLSWPLAAPDTGRSSKAEVGCPDRHFEDGPLGSPITFALVNRPGGRPRVSALRRGRVADIQRAHSWCSGEIRDGVTTFGASGSLSPLMEFVVG